MRRCRAGSRSKWAVPSCGSKDSPGLKSHHASLQIEKDFPRLFRRDGFYINTAKLVKNVLVGRVEERHLRGERAAARARGGAAQSVPAARAVLAARLRRERPCGGGGAADRLREHVQLVALKLRQDFARAF